MFGKNKRREPRNGYFGDKGYQMKDSYMADNLVVANFHRVSSAVTDYGPMHEKTKQKYIFEVIVDGEETKYREVFTGFIATAELEYFNLPYVENPVPFTECIPETEGLVLPKLSLLWTLNDINYSKEREKEETVLRRKPNND